MRLATALLLAAVPMYAAAQPAATPAPAKPVTSKPATLKPATSTTAATKPAAAAKPPGPHKPATPVVTAPKPAAHPAGAAKPAGKPAGKPVAGKPATSKPATSKPGAPKPGAPVTPAVPAPEPAADQKGSNTGLPLPRFAALKTDDVNFRRGPGTRYPIEWVYKRRDLPVQIEREFEVWRLVADPDGSKGWVQAATLTGRRTAIVIGAERVLRQSAAETAGAVAKLDKGVIVRVRACEAKSEWCQVQVNDYRGYIKRNEVWGVQPMEVIQ